MSFLFFSKDPFWILFQILLVRRIWLSIGWGTWLSRGWSSLLLQKGLQGQRQIHRHMARLSKKVLKYKRRNTLKTRMSARNQVDKFGSSFFIDFQALHCCLHGQLVNHPLSHHEKHWSAAQHNQGVHVNMTWHILDHFSEVPQVPKSSISFEQAVKLNHSLKLHKSNIITNQLTNLQDSCQRYLLVW